LDQDLEALAERRVAELGEPSDGASTVEKRVDRQGHASDVVQAHARTQWGRMRAWVSSHDEPTTRGRGGVLARARGTAEIRRGCAADQRGRCSSEARLTDCSAEAVRR